MKTHPALRIRAETAGAFIDAVYAIAVTILALEIPGTLGDDEFNIAAFAGALLEYAVAFALLFTFWLQHRRINALVEEVNRGGLWISAGILMLVCLVPRATTLVFEFGEDVTLATLKSTVFEGGGWTIPEVVDLFYVLTVVLIDVGILALLHINRRRADHEDLAMLRRSKSTTTILLVTVVCTSYLLPVENRYFLLVIPAALFFEYELSGILGWFSRSAPE